MDTVQIISLVLMVFLVVLVVFLVKGLSRGFVSKREASGRSVEFLDLHAEIPSPVSVRGEHEVLELACVKKWVEMPGFSHFALNAQKDVLLAVAKAPKGAAFPVGRFLSPVDYAFPVWESRLNSFMDVSEALDYDR